MSKSCKACNGHGRVPSVCHYCRGRGCKHCDGGVVFVQCKVCKGSGYIR